MHLNSSRVFKYPGSFCGLQTITYTTPNHLFIWTQLVASASNSPLATSQCTEMRPLTSDSPVGTSKNHIELEIIICGKDQRQECHMSPSNKESSQNQLNRNLILQSKISPNSA